MATLGILTLFQIVQAIDEIRHKTFSENERISYALTITRLFHSNEYCTDLIGKYDFSNLHYYRNYSRVRRTKTLKKHIKYNT